MSLPQNSTPAALQLLEALPLREVQDPPEEWVGKIMEEGRAEEIETQTKWAHDLEEFLYTYISKRPGRPLSTEARGVCFWAVKNYLVF